MHTRLQIHRAEGGFGGGRCVRGARGSGFGGFWRGGGGLAGDFDGGLVFAQTEEGQGILRDVLQLATNRGFILSEISTESDGYRHPSRAESSAQDEVAMVSVTLQVRGRALVNDLVAALSELKGVDAVLADDVDAKAE